MVANGIALCTGSLRVRADNDLNSKGQPGYPQIGRLEGLVELRRSHYRIVDPLEAILRLNKRVCFPLDLWHQLDSRRGNFFSHSHPTDLSKRPRVERVALLPGIAGRETCAARSETWGQFQGTAWSAGITGGFTDS